MAKRLSGLFTTGWPHSSGSPNDLGPRLLVNALPLMDPKALASELTGNRRTDRILRLWGKGRDFDFALLHDCVLSSDGDSHTWLHATFSWNVCGVR